MSPRLLPLVVLCVTALGAPAMAGTLEDINAIKRDNVDFVMKDGKVHKNWLPDENAPAFTPAGPKRDAYFGNL